MKTWLAVTLGGTIGLSCIMPLSAQENVPRSPEEGGPRVFEVATDALNLRAGPSTAAAKRASLDRGTVLTNLGCHESENRVWCNVRTVQRGTRGFVAAEYLTLIVGPDGKIARGPDDSALRAGRGDFDTVITIPCSRRPTGSMGNCEAAVARSGGGFATIVVKHSDGNDRVIYFVNGIATGSNVSDFKSGGNFVATKSADVYYINIDEERYEIVDAVILGD